MRRMTWMLINEKSPPINTWLLFLDGNKTMGHHPPFVHIDILNHRKEAANNYMHNYTHWMHLPEAPLNQLKDE